MNGAVSITTPGAEAHKAPASDARGGMIGIIQIRPAENYDRLVGPHTAVVCRLTKMADFMSTNTTFGVFGDSHETVYLHT
jgi:hypothetical protein